MLQLINMVLKTKDGIKISIKQAIRKDKVQIINEVEKPNN